MPQHARTAVEHWFIRRGLPHFIDDYSVRDDILTRLAPLLGSVFIAEVMLSVFGDRYTGFQQALAVCGALAMVTVAMIGLNKLRGRSPLRRPERVGPIELVAFVVLPVVVVAIFGSRRSVEAPVLFFGNIVLLAIAYPVTSYGIVPMTRWAMGQLRYQLRGMANLMIRTLPLLLLFSAFLFLNAEVWQVANDFAWPMFTAVLLGLVMIGVLFLALATQTHVEDLSRFASWTEVCDNCNGSPLADVAPENFVGPPSAPPLAKRARINVALVLFVSQSIQVVLIAAVTFSFYVLFGLLTVREDTIAQWIADGQLPAADRYGDLTVLGHELVLSRQLLVVAGFIAGFATLQFVVQLVTDASYREQFLRDMASETRQVLAVRTAYLASLASPSAAASS